MLVGLGFKPCSQAMMEVGLEPRSTPSDVGADEGPVYALEEEEVLAAAGRWDQDCLRAW